MIECNQAKTKSNVEEGITSCVSVAASPSSTGNVEIPTDHNTFLMEPSDVDKYTRVPRMTQPMSNICRLFCSSCCPQGDCDSRIAGRVGRYAT